MSLQSLIGTGTKVWLDSVHPDEVKKNRAWAHDRGHQQPDYHLRHHQGRRV